MIDLSAARPIALSLEKEYPVDWIRETEDEWIFGFYTGDPPIPGVLPLCVSKESGTTRWLYLPDVDNFKLLENAKLIASYYD